jgi:hypothetical protein
MPARAATVGTLTAVLALVAGAVVVMNMAPGSPGPCNRESAGSSSVAFELPNGPSLWERIPKMGRAPELESVDDPITVVVFEGPHRAVPIVPRLQVGQHSAPPMVLNNVVCVVSPGGEELYYTDVDMTGLDLGGLTLDRRDP